MTTSAPKSARAKVRGGPKPVSDRSAKDLAPAAADSEQSAAPEPAEIVPLALIPQKRGRKRPRSSVGRLPAKLARSRDALLGYFRPIFTAYGLTDSQWRVLRVLSTTDEMDAGETAHRAFLLPSSLSRILRELNDRGLIASWVAPNDARRSMHALSKTGRKLVDDIEPHLALVHQEIERRFGAERVKALAELLDAFSEELEA